MPNRTTRDYEGPAVAPRVQAALDAALQDEDDIEINGRYCWFDVVLFLHLVAFGCWSFLVIINVVVIHCCTLFYFHFHTGYRQFLCVMAPVTEGLNILGNYSWVDLYLMKLFILYLVKWQCFLLNKIISRCLLIFKSKFLLFPITPLTMSRVSHKVLRLFF